VVTGQCGANPRRQNDRTRHPKENSVEQRVQSNKRKGDVKMPKVIAILAVVLVASFSTPVRASEQDKASACTSVWDKTHTHILYITCPTGDVDSD
jgi:hypothetical protein